MLSSYSNTIAKFLSFYYKAMSNAPHPAVVARETIHGIEKVSNGSNAEPILRVTVGKDSKEYSESKRAYQTVNFMKG